MKKEKFTYFYIIFLYSFALFLMYFILVTIKNPGLFAFDNYFANYFYNHRLRFFDYFFVIISYFGETFALICFCLFLLILPNRKKLGFPVTIITFFGMFINLVIKIVVMRARPQGLFLTEPTLFYTMPDGYSFPSGHAEQGVVFFMSLSILLSQEAKKAWQQVLFITLGIIFSVLMCIARVYLCVHFLSDVLCGLSIAISILCAGYLILNKISHKHTITINSINYDVK